MRLRSYLIATLLVLSTQVILFGQTAKPVGPTEVPKAAPPFAVTSLEGTKLELASLRGKVVVLNFWFTGCEPCVAEMPLLNGLVDEFKNKDVVFIGLTWDNDATLRSFLKDHQFKYQIVPNAGDLIINTYSDGTGQIAFPEHIVIDQEGRITKRLSGGLITKTEPQRLKEFHDAIARLVDVPLKKAN